MSLGAELAVSSCLFRLFLNARRVPLARIAKKPEKCRSFFQVDRPKRVERPRSVVKMTTDKDHFEKRWKTAAGTYERKRPKPSVATTAITNT